MFVDRRVPLFWLKEKFLIAVISDVAKKFYEADNVTT